MTLSMTTLYIEEPFLMSVIVLIVVLLYSYAKCSVLMLVE
jgi:hypothetical protein